MDLYDQIQAITIPYSNQERGLTLDFLEGKHNLIPLKFWAKEEHEVATKWQYLFLSLCVDQPSKYQIMVDVKINFISK